MDLCFFYHSDIIILSKHYCLSTATNIRNQYTRRNGISVKKYFVFNKKSVRYDSMIFLLRVITVDDFIFDSKRSVATIDFLYSDMFIFYFFKIRIVKILQLWIIIICCHVSIILKSVVQFTPYHNILF